MAEVKFTDPAKEQLSDLEKEVRIRIYDKLEEIKDFTGIFHIFLNSFE
jgi:mRNA-degrading endonuclease RelE of RelBE toxin-antitoxin system